jgi:hypothetical protein
MTGWVRQGVDRYRDWETDSQQEGKRSKESGEYVRRRKKYEL